MREKELSEAARLLRSHGGRIPGDCGIILRLLVLVISSKGMSQSAYTGGLIERGLAPLFNCDGLSKDIIFKVGNMLNGFIPAEDLFGYGKSQAPSLAL